MPPRADGDRPAPCFLLPKQPPRHPRTECRFVSREDKTAIELFVAGANRLPRTLVMAVESLMANSAG